MTSKITDNFSRESLLLLEKDIDTAADAYYLGLARVSSYREEEDLTSLKFQRAVRETILAVKTISGSSFVVPRVNWDQNTYYDAYSDDVKGENDQYVMNSNNEVFVCISPSIDAAGTVRVSTVEPTSILANGQGKTFQTSDGYSWRYLYPLSNVDASRYLTNDFLPVKRITSTDAFLPVSEDTIQRALQDSAVGGEILGIAIETAGTGYTATNLPTVSIVGNGTNAEFLIDINEGGISRATVDSDGNGVLLHGSGYDYAEAVVSYGDAVLRPIISDQDGFGYDPRKTLKTNSLMLQTSFQGDEFDTILAQNDFHQVVIVKNLKKYNRVADSDYTGNTGLAVKSFDVTPGAVIFDHDAIFITSVNARGRVVHHDEVLGKLYYYQDIETGYTDVTGSASATQSGTNKSVTITGTNDPDVDVYSGEILYINNIGSSGFETDTSGVTREDAQTENIRIVLQLG